MIKFTQLLVILLTIQLVFSQNTHHEILDKYMSGPTKELFKVYHSLFEKNYDLNSEEGFKKYKAFKSNMKYIKEYNSKHTESQLGVGPWTDLTNEEYIQTVLTRPSVMKDQMQKLKNVGTPIKTNTKKIFDFENLRDEDEVEIIGDENNGKMNDLKATTRRYGAGSANWKMYDTEVRSQGSCGSCWAFAASAVAETNAAISANCARSNGCKQPYYSTQYLVDCTSDNGCSGGWFTSSLSMMKERGLVLDSAYQYKAADGTCPSSVPQTDNNSQVLGFDYCQNCSNDEWDALISQGAAAVAVDASTPEFQNYRSGVVSLSGCASMNHAVVAVSNGSEIILKNSWGSNWGDNGYITIRRDASNSCFVTQYGYRPNVKSSRDDPNPDPNPSPEPIPTPPTPTTNPRFCMEQYSTCFSTSGTLTDLSKYGYSDRMTSFVIAETNNGAYLFDNTQCRGNTLFIKESIYNFSKYHQSKHMYARVRSISVAKDLMEAGTVKLGHYKCFNSETTYYSNSNIAEDTRVRSIRFASNVERVELYTRPDFEGTGYSFNRALGNTEDSPMEAIADNIRSIKIFLK